MTLETATTAPEERSHRAVRVAEQAAQLAEELDRIWTKPNRPGIGAIFEIAVHELAELYQAELDEARKAKAAAEVAA